MIDDYAALKSPEADLMKLLINPRHEVVRKTRVGRGEATNIHESMINNHTRP